MREKCLKDVRKYSICYILQFSIILKLQTIIVDFQVYLQSQIELASIHLEFTI